jgi:RNA polymerase sigma factor (sigma-70 family)
VAINLAIDDVRRRRRQDTQPPPDVASPAALPDDAVVLVEQLARLSRRQREAVILRVVEDLAEEDVARLMGVSPGSVKVHKKRGLERLRVLLGHEQGAPHG